ncbi:MAG: hypothetical protein HY204_02335 [Nitrospirae bacterium]|nr:hypothetical protein [Nitrospirota bacterium]
MSLAESLRRVIDDLEESRGVALVGMDGILVEEKKQDAQLDLQTLGAEFSGLLKMAGKLAESVEFGGVKEIVTAAEGSTVILRLVTIDYFLMLVIRPDGNLGKARFLLRRAGAQIVTEL